MEYHPFAVHFRIFIRYSGSAQAVNLAIQGPTESWVECQELGK